MKRLLYITVSILVFSFLFKTPTSAAGENPTTLWPYQCVDTMKLSRDSARTLVNEKDYQAQVEKIVREIAGMGANCVAIGTPYDDEFLPYLTTWVDAARRNHLHVWFRGNFSSWEGWFNYPKNLTPAGQLVKTKAFILAHPELFSDGDVFTPAPEAENSWNGKQLQGGDYPAFRNFLAAENSTASGAFHQIGKNVKTNWLSMSGGVAKGVFDQATVDKIGKVVTLDHYVKTPEEMGQYIDYFHDTYGANLVLGEFGAPIPDLNGDMTEDEQAAFVDSLLKQLYTHKSVIEGINYWVITDGSTALLNSDGTERKAVAIIKKYYIPAVISGKVTDTAGDPIVGVTVSTDDGVSETKTDKGGLYRLAVPAVDVTLRFTKDQYDQAVKHVSIGKSSTYSQDASLLAQNQDIFYRIRLFFKNLIVKLFGSVKK